MTALLWLLRLQLAAIGSGDPCVQAASAVGDAMGTIASDTESASLYRAVGDEELAAGDVAAARVAYHEALRLDRRDSRARRALAEVCRPERPVQEATSTIEDGPGRFDEGTRLMQRGERAGAIAAFEAVRSSGPDPPAALLEGICELELGHERRAAQLLREAETDPNVKETASFFLGLIALNDGAREEARALLSTAASGGGSVAQSAGDLLRASRRDGRVVVSALTEVGFDSNVQLLPDGTTTGGGAGDAYASGLAGLFMQPFPASGPYARVIAQYRRQLQITAYDLGEVSGALGSRAGHGGRYLAAEYGYDWLSLGGSSYLSAHRLLGTGRWTSGRLSLSLAYAARLESFQTTATSGYSGLRHDADAEIGRQVSAIAGVAMGYHLGVDAARDATLGYFEQGPFTILRVGTASVRASAEARFVWRTYDGVDADLGIDRADRYLDGAATGECDVSDHWTVRAGVTARQALSNVPDFRYSKLTVSLGLVYAMGGL
jgi:tetratricopeptide (TPR) repeat protein